MADGDGPMQRFIQPAPRLLGIAELFIGIGLDRCAGYGVLGNDGR